MNHFKIGLTGMICAVFYCLVSLTSCKKDKTEDPNYVGTWTAEYPMTSAGITDNYRQTYTFTEATYNEITEIYSTTKNDWLDFVVKSGDISISADIITVTLKEFGASSYNNSGVTGIITKYQAGSSGFQSLCDLLGQSLTYELRFSVSGNQMTIKTDVNGDGDFADEYETMVYTKQ